MPAALQALRMCCRMTSGEIGPPLIAKGLPKLNDAADWSALRRYIGPIAKKSVLQHLLQDAHANPGS